MNDSVLSVFDFDDLLFLASSLSLLRSWFPPYSSPSGVAVFRKRIHAIRRSCVAVPSGRQRLFHHSLEIPPRSRSFEGSEYNKGIGIANCEKRGEIKRIKIRLASKLT